MFNHIVTLVFLVHMPRWFPSVRFPQR